MFNEEDIYNGANDVKYLFSENEDKVSHNSNIKNRGIKDIRYLFNENKDKITHNSNIKDIRCLFNENEDKESPFKSIIEDIKRGITKTSDIRYQKQISTSDIKSIKEKLTKFKNELFKNKNNMIKKDRNEYENQKSDFYKTEKMKNKTVSEIKVKKDLNEYRGIKDIRYLFNDNIYKGINH